MVECVCEQQERSQWSGRESARECKRETGVYMWVNCAWKKQMKGRDKKARKLTEKNIKSKKRKSNWSGCLAKFSIVRYFSITTNFPPSSLRIPFYHTACDAFKCDWRTALVHVQLLSAQLSCIAHILSPSSPAHVTDATHIGDYTLSHLRMHASEKSMSRLSHEHVKHTNLLQRSNEKSQKKVL